jgi:hypothetical protein
MAICEASGRIQSLVIVPDPNQHDTIFGVLIKRGVILAIFSLYVSS